MPGRRAAVVVVALLAARIIASGQDPQAPTPVFRSRVDLVHFDVSVLDKGRHPVRGLTASDFTVLEDGKPQPIVAFSAVDVPPPAPPPAKWMREVSPDVRTNEPAQNPEGRLFILLIDDALLPPDPWALRSAKKIARGVLDRLSAIDQVAVVFSIASRNAQDFTTDRKKLLTAIDSLQAGSASHVLGWDTAVPKDPRNPGGPSVPAVDGDAGLRLGSLRTLQQVAEALVAAPQRRKALIFISPGVTVDLASDAQPVKIVGGGPGIAIREANHQLAMEMPEVFRRMQQANVTIYSVDPCGLGGLEGYILGVASGLKSLQNPSPSPPDNWLAPVGPPAPRALAHHVATVDMDFLMAASANTGGHAIVNTNDFEPGLDGIFEENGSYYLLGYVKPSKNAAGSLHRVSVKVNRPGVTVRTRTGYETTTERGPDPKTLVTTELSRASAGPVAASGLPLRIAVAPVAVPGGPGRKEEAAVTIVLGLRQTAVTTRTRETVNLQTRMFTPDGRAVGAPIRQTATFTLVPGGGDVLRYEVLTQVAVAPGRYALRVAAHRATDGLTGSVYCDVDVPDFAKAPLSLSGVWLEAMPGPTAVPQNAFVALAPVVPTSSREFKATDTATVFFRIYEGGSAPLAPVALSMRIVNDRDVVVAGATGTVGVERFAAAGRAADHRFALPLQNLSAGTYLLEFEASLGTSKVSRHVTFAVR